MADLCRPPADQLAKSYDQGFLKTPTTTPYNLYPENSSCFLEVCTTASAILIELALFNIAAEYDGTCLDYVAINNEVQLCSPQLQGAVIPFNTDGCFLTYFHSNSDGKTGSGVKLRFKSKRTTF